MIPISYTSSREERIDKIFEEKTRPKSLTIVRNNSIKKNLYQSPVAQSKKKRSTSQCEEKHAKNAEGNFTSLVPQIQDYTTMPTTDNPVAKGAEVISKANTRLTQLIRCDDQVAEND